MEAPEVVGEPFTLQVIGSAAGAATTEAGANDLRPVLLAGARAAGAFRAMLHYLPAEPVPVASTVSSSSSSAAGVGGGGGRTDVCSGGNEVEDRFLVIDLAQLTNVVALRSVVLKEGPFEVFYSRDHMAVALMNHSWIPYSYSAVGGIG